MYRSPVECLNRTWMAVGGVGLSVAGSMLAKKGAKPGSIVYGPSSYESAKQNGQGANLDSLMNNNTAYINNNMQRINAGRAPEYAENLIASQAPYLQRQAKQQFMGRPGDRGGSVMGLQSQNAAMMGLNPKARASMMNKTFMDYQNAQSGIDQQMANLRFNSSKDMAMALPGWSTGQQGSTANMMQVGGGIMTPGTEGKYAGLGQAMSGIGGMMFGQGLGGIGAKSAMPSGGGNFTGGISKPATSSGGGMMSQGFNQQQSASPWGF